MVRTVITFGQLAGDECTDVYHIKCVAVSVFIKYRFGSFLTRGAGQVDDVRRQVYCVVLKL